MKPKTDDNTLTRKVEKHPIPKIPPKGFIKIKERIHKNGRQQPIYYYPKTKAYITPDVDQHNGGWWKMAYHKYENLLKKDTRAGTYNEDLTIRIGD